ncbi:hypothetical protein GGR57DRAFT_472353 [Xylariaceae sp. FL1272]|nr:hypothetical protein GGR57DRAFT_472353 [Xylariaceae sp. FL1272]
MPVFQQDLGHGRRRDPDQSANHRFSDAWSTMASPSPPDHRHQLRSHPSEESIRTEFCEGPIPETQSESLVTPAPANNASSPSTCTDRADLIERIKKGESPAWIPHRHLESFWGQQQPISPTHSPTKSPTSSSLLSAPTITPERSDRRRQDGIELQRPPSALHSGDFTFDDPKPSPPRDCSLVTMKQRFGEGSDHPWLATSPPRDFNPFEFEKTRSFVARSDTVRSALSSLTSSISTSFAYQPPTSPLVQSESNDDQDLASPIDGIDIGANFPRQQRRHTVLSGSYGFSPSPLQRQPPSLRQERTFPAQAHQPRRSLTSVPIFSGSAFSPQTPALLHSRRPSIGSDLSPLHASMVGSYEESILRGRMSTTPSKPLGFLAQIGVLGLGKCKASLRCPPHVTLPFPAVFYSYAGSSYGRSKEDEGPSPYVGQIDLENGLQNQEDAMRSKRKHQARVMDRRAGEEATTKSNSQSTRISSSDARMAQRKRRSGSPKAPPGGSYRIPERGQIQIIIKNPNKTAVKLFLVPYDLTGMEPGTKTFVRQRSYSNGPIIDEVSNLNRNLSTDRPTLRYLVHLHICCPSRGRYYLYKNIRVVFANRVPDGKERLKNETTLPEPRFSPYRQMHPPSADSIGRLGLTPQGREFPMPEPSHTAGAGFRRSNSGVSTDEGFEPSSLPRHLYSLVEGCRPVEQLPFSATSRDAVTVNGETVVVEPQLFKSLHKCLPTTQNSGDGLSLGGCDPEFGRYDKLTGYGSALGAESLLSQRLKSLGVQKRDEQHQRGESQA